MMWLRPTQLGVRRNPWNKAYGGEGTWTLEPTGDVNGYYGVAGSWTPRNVCSRFGMWQCWH